MKKISALANVCGLAASTPCMGSSYSISELSVSEFFDNEVLKNELQRSQISVNE
jgi:hypothetical protein